MSYLEEFKHNDREVFLEFERLLEVMEQTELLESALEDFGYSSQISKIFNIDQLCGTLELDDSVSSDDLPLVVDDPESDNNTQLLLSSLHVAMEKISKGVVKKATDTISAGDKKLSKLTDEYKTFQAALDEYKKYGFDNEKLKLQNLNIVDYAKMLKALKSALTYINTSTHHARILKIKKLNEWFANLDGHVDEYNKLVNEYVRWCEDKLNIDALEVDVTPMMVANEINRVYYNELIDSIKTTRLLDNPWYKNYKQAITTGMDVSSKVLRVKDIWEADKLQTSKNFGFWRINRIKSAHSSKFKKPLSWLLRMSVADLVYYNNHLGLVLSYVYGGVVPLIIILNYCKNPKK